MNPVRGERILRPSPFRMLGFSLACLGFAAVGLLLIHDGEWLGWPVVVFCGVGTLLFAAVTVPGACHLRLTRDGFEIRTLWRTAGIYRWSDVERFRAGRVGLNKAVVFDFADSYGGQETARAIAKEIGGAEGALPDSYGLSVEALAAIMNEYREAALNRRI